MLGCNNRRHFSSFVGRITSAGVVLFLPLMMQGQTDPGLRGGTAGAGSPFSGLGNVESQAFNHGLDAFQEKASVTGTIGATEAGLGPRFNLDSCAGCHAQPAIGGSSPKANPQVAVASLNGATNVLPSFITLGGPIREVRFKSDGGVHDLFTIAGMSDAPGCNIAQPDFAAADKSNNLSFRIPTPVFGAGLIEGITDSAIVANKLANDAAKKALGISGHENREGNTGTITRFGWKAQNKSLTIFSGEAYNVEQGVSNEVFPQEREDAGGCLFNPTPEDHTSFASGPAKDVIADVIAFANFMRFLAPPTPVSSFGIVKADSITNGQKLFGSEKSIGVGCFLCHTPSLTTGVSPVASLTNITAALYSDLLVHDMGPGLADGITQGSATGSEFKTAPLWGLGQRIFFLHDGRTSDLVAAIQAHSSKGSEASDSVTAFNKLSVADRQDIVNFLRSL
jgi:CxxC motif-containing protein (DUF1111 family)